MTSNNSTEFISDMNQLLDDLREFDIECEAEGRTDSGAFWEIVEPRITRWRPPSTPSTVPTTPKETHQNV